MTVLDVLPYRQATRDLADDTAARVLAALAAYEAGALTAGQLQAVVAAIVAAADSRAVSMADLALAAALTAALGVVVAPVGLPFVDPTARLAEAVSTILDGPDDRVRWRLVLLARAEPLAAGQEATTAAMVKRRNVVRGWMRATGPTPCPVCEDLADGTVLPADVDMFSHPGCSCIKRAVVHTRTTIEEQP